MLSDCFDLHFSYLQKAPPSWLTSLSICVCVCVWHDLGSFSFGLFAFSPWFVGLLSKLEKWDIWNLRETKAIPRCHLYFLLSRYLAKGCREIFPFHDFWISCIIKKTFPTLKFIKEFTHVLSETFTIWHLGFILGIFWDIGSSGSFSPFPACTTVVSKNPFLLEHLEMLPVLDMQIPCSFCDLFQCPVYIQKLGSFNYWCFMCQSLKDQSFFLCSFSQSFPVGSCLFFFFKFYFISVFGCAESSFL